jgi:hypothetical protein
MHALSLVFAVSLIPPQEPAPASPQDLRELAARVDLAHRPDGPVPPVTAFKSSVKLVIVDKATPGGEVELQVDFLLWKPPGRDREQALIKYELRDAGAPIVRGRDREGYWQLFQNEAKDLRGAEFEQDLAACRKHTNLARQLVQFLDPGAVLRSLEQPSPVHEEELRFHTGEQGGAPVRGTKTPCLVVEGRLPSFPLLQHGGDDAPVQLKVFVSKGTSHLLAVEATPLVNGKPDAASMERVNLLDLKPDAGLLVPRTLEHFFTADNGSLHLQSRVVLSPTLRPELRVEDFDRPKR